jgi:pimeloyl-ACP methyl ester carboxylesterase
VRRRAAHEGRSIEVNGAAVYVKQHGSATPVVLIHGGLMSHAMWEPLLPALKGGIRTITPAGEQQLARGLARRAIGNSVLTSGRRHFRRADAYIQQDSDSLLQPARCGA